MTDIGHDEGLPTVIKVVAVEYRKLTIHVNGIYLPLGRSAFLYMLIDLPTLCLKKKKKKAGKDQQQNVQRKQSTAEISPY